MGKPKSKSQPKQVLLRGGGTSVERYGTYLDAFEVAVAGGDPDVLLRSLSRIASYRHFLGCLEWQIDRF